jgi:hypothetical protein
MTLKNQADDIYFFAVEFSLPDGALFVRGPCCGADETQMPSTSKFEYRVQAANSKYFVLDMPVYVP